VPPSRRLQAGALLFALLVMLSLWLAPSPSWWWRLLAGLLALGLAWHPLRAIVFQRGLAAVRRFEWAADGAWWVTPHGGRRTGMRLAGAPAGFGPWVLLVWRATPGGGDDGHRGRCYALIDARNVGPEAFRALRGRLKLSRRHRDAGQADDNC
jgi:hypothetical protein